MKQLNDFFTFKHVFQTGAIVFSFLFIVITIQMYADVSRVVRTVVTKRNHAFIFTALILIITSILLFILGFVIL